MQRPACRRILIRALVQVTQYDSIGFSQEDDRWIACCRSHTQYDMMSTDGRAPYHDPKAIEGIEHLRDRIALRCIVAGRIGSSTCSKAGIYQTYILSDIKLPMGQMLKA